MSSGEGYWTPWRRRPRRKSLDTVRPQTQPPDTAYTFTVGGETYGPFSLYDQEIKPMSSNNNNSNISVSVRDTDTKVRMVVTSVSGHERTDTIMSLSDLNNLITTLCDARNEAQNSVSNLWKSVGSTIQAGRDC